MPPVVEVTDLHKSYGDVHAVQGISFAVDPGECVAVLGPNGAGKTTTIEVLEGFRAPDAGTVRVLGFEPAHAGSDYRSRIGVVLQECGIDRYLTVEEVLRMNASYYPRPRSVAETITMVGLDEKRTSRVKTLSGGQQRRLDVALGIIGDPDLLFLDEPTTGFDPSARRQAWELVHTLRGLGKTVLLTTHYMDEAQSLADRVIVIAQGRIIAEGTPETIGGRAQAQTRVTFTWPPDRPLDGLPVPVTREGDTVVIATDTPTAALRDLTAWALGHGGELPGLSVTRPSLEDVYLDLIGERT
ncbi:MAG: ABC transporter ATP-binding protein [Actinobacteria bacterium]|nr:ABC transporter ATP-binding protein [Actinomycetota bacterium]MBS1900262.1 ABC transporter ATP-binding protein [Actinomycetota bacterium]